ncbi:MAG: GMC family oxidoreductase N-terminal domain-containing protein [Anaerolineaceae bacterium]|nr:GMC family oxidoreductase N-terminal domain-containing protein [Anaerolineaceae bacterium]
MAVQPSLNASKHENRLAFFLSLIAGMRMFVALALIIAPYILRDLPFFTAPPFFFTNTVAGVVLVALTAWFASGDVRRFRNLAVITDMALWLGAASYLTMLISPAGAGWQIELLLMVGTYSTLALIVAYLLWKAAPESPSWSDWVSEKATTTWERIGQVVYGAFGIISFIAVAGSLIGAFIPSNPLADLWAQPVFVAGSALKIGTLGILSLAVALKIRQRLKLMTLVILGHAGSWVVITILAIFGYWRFGDYTLTIGSMTVGVSEIMFGAWLLDVVIIAVFGFIQNRINASVVDHVNFFAPFHFRVLEALIETLIEGSNEEGKSFERVEPYQCALNTDVYLSSFHSNRLFLAKLALMGTEYMPLMWFKQPMTWLRPEARHDFINRRFKQEILEPPARYRFLDRIFRGGNALVLRTRGPITPATLDATMNFSDLLEGIMRFDMQMTYLGYYGDDRTWEKDEEGNGIGYVPFSKRPKSFKVVPRRPHPPLDVTLPEDIARQGVDVIHDADVVIIGSGAAGAMMAERLLERGRSVLMLERGIYSHPDTFNENEIDMVSRLYSDGALQISQSLRFTILQGSAVGGTTVVNNAVCFDTPEHVVDTWNARNDKPVIDKEKYYQSQKAVRERMSIGRIKTGTRTPIDDLLNHGDTKINAGVQRYFENHPELGEYKYDIVEANITDCLGCGYCNIGCKYGRKISMLDEVLPKAQADYGADRFRILSEAEVVHLGTSNGKVNEIVVNIRGKRKLVIKDPKTVVVSAGAVASSWLLMRSGIGKNLPVGKGLCFNMGSPLYGWFGEPINAYEGLQIAHYLDIKGKDGFVYETWFNPPLAQALTMPGWLDTHFKNMQRYNEMVAVGVLVGTESNAYIDRALLINGPDVVYKPSKRDLDRLLEAFQILGGVLFEAGAKEVFAATRKYHSYTPVNGNAYAQMAAPNDLAHLADLVHSDDDLLLGTGHPQGGNAIGSRPDGTGASVVDEHFKVYGYDNLYVCDASVHPTATTVNPQLTVMTLAHYAAQFIE